MPFDGMWDRKRGYVLLEGFFKKLCNWRGFSSVRCGCVSYIAAVSLWLVLVAQIIGASHKRKVWHSSGIG
jgi:hypothetical protein